MPDVSHLSPILNQMLAHLEWADERTTRSLLQAEQPPEEALKLFSHVLGAEERWLSRMEARDPQLEVWPELDAHACARQAAENAAKLRQFVQNLPEGGLERVVHYTVSNGTSFATRVDDILIHMCLHGAYHRGQVALLLRRNGNVPIPTDYIVYDREMRS